MAGLFTALTFLVNICLPAGPGVVKILSIRETILLVAAVISAYTVATGIFLWKGRSIPRCD